MYVFGFAKKQKDELIQLMLLFTFDWIAASIKSIAVVTEAMLKRGVLRDMPLQYNKERLELSIEIIVWTWHLILKSFLTMCMEVIFSLLTDLQRSHVRYPSSFKRRRITYNHLAKYVFWLIGRLFTRNAIRRVSRFSKL